MYSPRLAAWLIGISCTLALAAQGPVFAQDEPPPPSTDTSAQAADPPARVARLSQFTGNVSYTPAGENDWVQAQLNRPIVTGDKLWTDANARAELEIGPATLHLDHDTSFDFLDLKDELAQIELTQGSLSLDVRRLHGNETYEIDTPTIAFVASRVGDYRVDVDPRDGSTVVTVRRGGGDAVGENGKRFAIEEGQSVRFPNSALTDVQVNNVGPADDFDGYVLARDERYAHARSSDYVSSGVIGSEDLDDNGTWEDSPDYGHVWYPTGVADDWAPYHDGRWTWVAPWGWTWVDDAPWGFAPFHYGRWAYIGSRWGWVPGPVAVAPVYAPALVAFVGGGGLRVDVSIGGPIGWFPLGPRDVYFPGYRCGRDYFTRINVSSGFVDRRAVVNYYGSWSRGSINYASLHYANRDAPRALAAMPARSFAAGDPVARSAVRVDRAALANARVMPRAALAPTRASLLAGGARVPPPQTAAFKRPVVATRRPAPPPSFAARQSMLQRAPGQPLTSTQLRTLAARNPAAQGAAPTTNVRVAGERNAVARQPAPNAAAAANGAARLRSSAFAHAGAANAVNTPRTANAPRIANTPRNPAPNTSRTPNRSYSPAAREHLPSSTFAHNGAPGRPGAVPQNSRATIASHTPARVPERGNPAPALQRHVPSSNFAQGSRQREQNAIAQRTPTYRPQQQRAEGARLPSSAYAQSRPRTESATPSMTARNASPPRTNAPANRPNFAERAPPRPAPQERSVAPRSSAPANRPSFVERAPPRQAPQQFSRPPAPSSNAPRSYAQARPATPPPHTVQAPKPAAHQQPPPPRDRSKDDKQHGG
ncbi:MAG TPA: DUF6600 domain-containing protein [Rudaea sp.]|nr:DUF6600 domain-containing protein [Rudaea sp.]